MTKTGTWLRRGVTRLAKLGMASWHRGPRAAGRPRPGGWLLVGAALGALLLCAGATRGYGPARTALAETPYTAYAVVVDSETLGYVSNPAIVQEAVGAEAVMRGFALGTAVPLQQIHTEARRGDTPFSTDNVADLQAALAPHLTFGVSAAELVINGDTVLTLANQQAVETVLARVKQDYLARIGADADDVQVTTLKPQQTVAVRTDPAPPDTITTDLDQAVAILEKGTDEQVSHKVAKGETLWEIAKDNNLQPGEIVAANPGINPDSLQIGQAVSLVVPKPYITFLDTEVRVQKQRIPYATETVHDADLYPWQRDTRRAGSAGVKQVETKVFRQDGKVVSSDVLSSKVLKDPVTAVVAVGTKPVPADGTGKLIWPTNGGVITSPFGPRPRDFHRGIDIGVPIGTPVYAADNGTVIAAGREGNYGLRVMVDHGNGIVTLYGHLSKIKVKAGQQVKKGQIVGLSGMTGNATGPHLHFEVRKDGTPVNPIPYLKPEQ